eukprot:8932881-Alexandrium_andersonii.AAC.1
MPNGEGDSADHTGDSSGDDDDDDDDYVHGTTSRDTDGPDADGLEHDDGIYKDDRSYHYGGDGEKWDELGRQLFPGLPLPCPGRGRRQRRNGEYRARDIDALRAVS